MKATEVFDVCHTRYRGLREWLAGTRGAVRSVHLDTPSEGGYQWRPSRARACEYVADFERIGRRALRRPEWKGRLKLFETYFLRGIEYRRAIEAVGVAEGTFDYWYREVKRALGAEFSRTGLFPPSRYFAARNCASARSSEAAANASENAARPGRAGAEEENRARASEVPGL
ncbi:MAG: hypothetical protein KGL02_04605 [Acidobacteriota bacterium]|nr:hypothetical protein [Acidobacteriota bacterium]MDE3168626.1 hypothetical protein [Acidobacteriota bacterium]